MKGKSVSVYLELIKSNTKSKFAMKYLNYYTHQNYLILIDEFQNFNSLSIILKTK